MAHNPTLFTSSATGPQYQVHSDGGARGNPGPAAAAYFIHDHNHKLIHQAGHYLGETTNNVAEYSAVKLALEYIIAHVPLSPAPHLDFYLDSLLVAEQLTGHYKIKQPHLMVLAQDIHDLLSTHTLSADFHAIPREQNAQADALVNQVLDTR